MANIYVPILTTDAVNSDQLDATDADKRRPWPRVITRVGYSGSAAVGDAKLAIYIESTFIMEVENSRLGLAPNNDDMQDVYVPVPPNAAIRVLVITAPGTNAGRAKIVTQP